VSDVIRSTRKISREGIVLIKSFEGFRPRAVRNQEDGWIIGYGHTLSAREGATVSEADAELLLRYDLMPIEKSINDAAPGLLNQHQFDAMASFGFSVGRERFETSDVLGRLSSGATAEAADAMMGWPAAEVPSAGLRRRAAERALFVADPSRPISLADLLTTPLREVAPEQAPEAGSDAEAQAASAPVSETVVVEAVAEDGVDPAPAEPVDSRGAAVAALLGEARGGTDGSEPVIPTFETAARQTDDQAVATSETRIDPVDPDPPLAADVPATPGEPLVATAANDAEASEASPEPAEAVNAADTPPSDGTPGGSLQTALTDDAPVSFAPPAATSPAVDVSALNQKRYAPYGTPIVGPLPFLQPAAPVEARPQTETTPTAFEEPASTDPLVLTSPEDAPYTGVARAPWTAEEREEAEAIAQPEANLFGDDLSLTQGGRPLSRPDFEPEAPVRFDWSETGAFIIMGAVGLTAFGASMAAFRLASEQGGGDETSIIGWVLAVIGVACVGVSSLNLYRRFGLPGGDRQG
jgi:lysozyme